MHMLLFVVFANEVDNNATVETSEDSDTGIIVVKDTSGLTPDQLRKRAQKVDKAKKLKKEAKSTKLNKVKKWEDLSPTPKKYDWIQTKSGEWFKGTIKSMFDDKLEFDSDEIGLHTFDFPDVIRIKSYHIISVNIENLATFPGILRLDNGIVTIIQGDHKYDFKKDDVVSFAPDGKKERNLWSGKVTASLDVRTGNKTQHDISVKVDLQRRTAKSRLLLDYLGRISSKDNEEINNDHRINQKYDRYLTRKFFWTPVFSEFFTDKYKNIDTQVTLGAGIGYTMTKTKELEINFSGGPAFLYTRYYTTPLNKREEYNSLAIELSTKIEYEVNKITDITYDYKLTYTGEESGKYKHHMILSFENELTKWLDLDISGIWDYILYPEMAEDGTTPEQSDFQILVGLGIDF